ELLLARAHETGLCPPARGLARLLDAAAEGRRRDVRVRERTRGADPAALHPEPPPPAPRAPRAARSGGRNGFRLLAPRAGGASQAARLDRHPLRPPRRHGTDRERDPSFSPPQARGPGLPRARSSGDDLPV